MVLAASVGLDCLQIMSRGNRVFGRVAFLHQVFQCGLTRSDGELLLVNSLCSKYGAYTEYSV